MMPLKNAGELSRDEGRHRGSVRLGILKSTYLETYYHGYSSFLDDLPITLEIKIFSNYA